MRVGVELLQLEPGVSGGIVPLWTGVLRELFALAPDVQFFIYGTSRQRSLLSELPANVRWSEISGPSLLQEMDVRLLDDEVELLLRSFPLDQELFFPAGRQIFLIPDVQHEAFPELFDTETLARRRKAFSHASRHSGAVGVISEATRSALVSIYPETEGKTFLMPPALVRSADESDAPLSPEELALIPEQPYFLFPANLWPHKNHRRLLDAFRRFNQSSPERYALVLTGHPGGWEDLRELAGEEPVYHLGFIRRELLRELFCRACALTYFSLYEGFGMPLLEAFDVGLPVLCSNTSSLPEVGGDAVLSCDPTDAGAMAQLMHQITQNEELRRTMIGRGKGRLDLFSWRGSAENLLNALAELRGQHPPQRSGFAGRPSRVFLRWWNNSSGSQKKQIREHYRKMHEQARSGNGN